jgi:hypothetical protein
MPRWGTKKVSSETGTKNRKASDGNTQPTTPPKIIKAKTKVFLNF